METKRKKEKKIEKLQRKLRYNKRITIEPKGSAKGPALW